MLRGSVPIQSLIAVVILSDKGVALLQRQKFILTFRLNKLGQAATHSSYIFTLTLPDCAVCWKNTQSVDEGRLIKVTVSFCDCRQRSLSQLSLVSDLIQVLNETFALGLCWTILELTLRLLCIKEDTRVLGFAVGYVQRHGKWLILNSHRIVAVC